MMNVLKHMIVMAIIFSSINLKAMKVDQRIAELQLKRSQKLDGISQRARGDMTAHKALYEKAEPELNMINEEIKYLGQLNAFFVGLNQSQLNDINEKIKNLEQFKARL